MSDETWVAAPSGWHYCIHRRNHAGAVIEVRQRQDGVDSDLYDYIVDRLSHPMIPPCDVETFNSLWFAPLGSESAGKE